MIVCQSVLYKINSDKKQVILKYDFLDEDDCEKNCKSVFNFNCMPWEKETPKPAKKEKVIVKFNSDSEEEEETPIEEEEVIEETPIEEEEVIEETPIEETNFYIPKPAKKEKVVKQLPKITDYECTEYHDEYHTKKYTMFITEAQLDKIREGLALLSEKEMAEEEVIEVDELVVNETYNFFLCRLLKIKENIKKKLAK